VVLRSSGLRVVVFIAAIDDYAMRTPATDGDVLGGPCIDEV